MLFAHGDDAYVERISKLGAAGYIIKQTAAKILPVAIRDAIHGWDLPSTDLENAATILIVADEMR